MFVRRLIPFPIIFHTLTALILSPETGSSILALLVKIQARFRELIIGLKPLCELDLREVGIAPFKVVDGYHNGGTW